MPWEWKETADKAKKSGRGENREKRAKYTELDMYPWVYTELDMYPVVTDSATEISMKLAKEPDGVIAQSIQETEQEYADVHAAERR